MWFWYNSYCIKFEVFLDSIFKIYYCNYIVFLDEILNNKENVFMICIFFIGFDYMKRLKLIYFVCLFIIYLLIFNYIFIGIG